MTYWTLNALFLAVALVIAVVAAVTRRRQPPGSVRRPVALLLTALVLFVISVVFDNVMIGIGLVGYNADLISGAFLGIAPLEDFAYVIGAVLLLPALWLLLPARRADDRRAT